MAMLFAALLAAGLALAFELPPALSCIAFLIAGFILLIKGADFFVDGASALAHKLKVPALIIGLTVVAFGTSAPELAVSLTASADEANSLAVSNVIGSNIFNLLVVLGVCAAIKPIPIKHRFINRDFPISVAVTLVFFAFIIFSGGINRVEAIVLLALFVGYVAYTIISARRSRSNPDAFADEITDVPQAPAAPEKEISALKCFLLIVGGIAGIVFGGRIVVNNAVELTRAFGVSETLIGLTVCAIGTSLPELVTSIVAARKGEADMAVGNAVGSNIFNLLFILGLTGTIAPITIKLGDSFGILIDCGIYAGVSVLAYIFCITGKKLSRAEGGTMLCLYAAYMVFAVLRETGVIMLTAA